MSVKMGGHEIVNAFAIQNWGNSGSVFLHSLFDGHPNVLAMPYFHARGFYKLWDERLQDISQEQIVDEYIQRAPHLFEPGRVNRPGGLHRLGLERNQYPHVDKTDFEKRLRDHLAEGPITRRALFIAAHLAYAQCLGRNLSERLIVLYPVHGRIQKYARMLVDDFPRAKFIHTLRECVGNMASAIKHHQHDNLDYQENTIEALLRGMLSQREPDGAPRFGARPYFPDLTPEDRAAAIRLEDLHARPRDVMKALADWLEIPWADALLESTFNGLTWWNRPESPARKGFDASILGRNVSGTLSALDRRRVAAITEPKARAWGYPNNASRPFRQALLNAAFFGTVWFPWREEARAYPSPLRALELLIRLKLFLSEPLSMEIEQALDRERIRYRYLCLNKGAQTVHEARSDADRPKPIQCLLLLSKQANGDGYDGRVCEGLNFHGVEDDRDYVAVKFADELGAPKARPASVSALGLLVALAGLVVRIRDYAAIRYWTVRAFFASRRDHGSEVRLLAIAADAPRQPRASPPSSARAPRATARENTEIEAVGGHA